MSLNNKQVNTAEKIQKQDLRILLKLSPFIKPYKKIATIALMALIVTSLSFLLFGQGIKLFIDEGIYTLQHHQLIIIAVVLITLVIGTFFRFYFVSWIGERVSNDVRLAVFNHLLTLHPHYFEMNRSGEINARLTTDTTLLQSIFGFSISMALSSSLFIPWRISDDAHHKYQTCLNCPSRCPNHSPSNGHLWSSFESSIAQESRHRCRHWNLRR